MTSYFLRWKGEREGVSAQSPLRPTHADTLHPSPANYHAISPAATSDQHAHRLPSAHAALATPPRPQVARAVTTATAVHTEHALQPVLPRRQLHPRALTSTATIASRPELYTHSTMDSRPSLLSRAKTVISNQLELGEGTSYAHKNAPPSPSHWSDQTHTRYLVKLWDAIEDRAANAKYQVSTTARLVSTEKNMLHVFPELGEGDRALTREWIEYVLGVALRHPFCTADKMGRWEILASSSGTRGTWGPW